MKTHREQRVIAPRVAVLEKRGRFLVGEPFFRAHEASGRGSGGRSVPVERNSRAKLGDLVLLRTGRGAAKVLRVIGRPDNARAVLEALMLERLLSRRFDPAVERAARGSASEHPRRDLTALPTLTIDPATARDFDDAISAERLESGESRVWVHIADVSAFVAPGSLVDREAYKRGTSVYVPGLVEPMLPEALSNDSCSLRPGVDRFAVTCEMDFSGEGVVRSAFYRSVIRSDKRLDYEEVDEIFAGSASAEEPWAEPLSVARGVAASLAARRARTGALAVDAAEPEFTFDDEGNVAGVTRREQTESHRLIEHLMIAANEQVATLLEQRGVPALYRVHERPPPERVQRLVAQLASLGVPTPPLPEVISPQQASDLVGEISVRVEEHVRRVGHGREGLTSLVLRSLQQAYYSPRNIGHAGLHSLRYCHFTSPIRRYPDLVCHRALLSAVGGGEEAPKASALGSAGEWASARERNAMIIERDADDIAAAFLLERVLFEGGFETVFEGEVVSVIGAGAFVSFGDGFEGLLPVRRLGRDWYELNEEGTILQGEHSALRVGDPVRVRVDRVETARGRVDLVPADSFDG